MLCFRRRTLPDELAGRTHSAFVAARYIGALLETDDSKLAHRIYEALAAIEQRLLSPVESGSDEEKALKTAQKLLAIIKAEKLDRQA
jgi:hypothetical protein